MMKAYVEEKAVPVDLYYNDLHALDSSIAQIYEYFNKEKIVEFLIPINRSKKINFYYIH